MNGQMVRAHPAYPRERYVPMEYTLDKDSTSLTHAFHCFHFLDHYFTEHDVLISENGILNLNILLKS